MSVLAELPAGVVVWKRYRDYAMLACNHDGSHQVRRADGELWCAFCKADESRTEEFGRRVLVFARLAPSLTADVQAALF